METTCLSPISLGTGRRVRSPLDRKRIRKQPFPCSAPRPPVSKEQTNQSLFSSFISCVAEIMPLSPHNDRVGFYNEGNSCFVNAATQVWLQGLACCIVPSPSPGSSVVSAEGQVRTTSEGWRMAFTLGHSREFFVVYPRHDRGGVLPDQGGSHFHCICVERAFIRCGISLRRIAARFARIPCLTWFGCVRCSRFFFKDWRRNRE